MRRGWPVASVRLLLATLLALAGVALGVPRATADEPEAEVKVGINALSPALPARDGTVRLRGTVENTSKTELTNLQAVVWRSLDPIADTEGLDRALTSAANEPLGERVADEFENIPSESDRSLAPGERTRFDLEVPVAALELPSTDAIYLVGVHIRGRTDPVGPDVTLGRGRVFLPLVSDPPANPLEMTSLVVLTSRPSWVRTGVLADDHLADEVAAGGRLRALLDAAQADDVSFAVDPALVEELLTMQAGYRVLTGDESVGGEDETTEGRGKTAAARWLDDFADLVRDGDGFRLLYGNPDIAALVHDKQTAVLEQAAQSGDSVTSTRTLPLLVLPAQGRADRATVEAAEALRPAAIVLSDRSAKGDGPLLAGPSGGASGGSAPIVSYTSTALSGGPGPAPRETPVKVRQRMLADTWLEANTTPEGRTRGRVRLLTSVDQAVGAEPDLDTPWLRPSTLSELLDATPSDFDPADLRYGARARDAEIDLSALGTVRRLREDYQTAGDLFVAPAAIRAEARRVVPRAASGAWRTDPEAASFYGGLTSRRLTGILRDEVTITVTPRVTTTGRAATFPITVRNGLPAAPSPDGTDANAVKVVIRFDSSNRQRLRVAPVNVPRIDGDGRVTDNAQVQAETNGTVRVSAQLFTSTGRPIGRPVPVQVNATQAGTTGWIIAIAAGVVLVGTTALRIRQVARERSESTVTPVPVSRPGEDLEPTETSSLEGLEEPRPPRETLDV